jgi:hypothetical protein
MAFTDPTDDLQFRCGPQLLRLRMLTRGEPGAMLPWQVIAEVREATNAVIAAAEAAGRAALAGAGGDRGGPDSGVFLWVRLTRLVAAADEAVNAACGTDAAGLRRCLDRFEVLTDAIWAVQHDVYGQAPLRRVGPDRPSARPGTGPASLAADKDRLLPPAGPFRPAALPPVSGIHGPKGAL